jgi:Fe2+ or Zn2+ uptake regulation protein
MTEKTDKCRASFKRMLILDAIVAHDGVFCAADIICELEKYGMTKATIYNTINLFVRENIIEKVPTIETTVYYRVV